MTVTLAVLFEEYTSGQSHPTRVIENPEAIPEGWVEMTLQEYLDAKASSDPAYATYLASQQVSSLQTQAVEKIINGAVQFGQSLIVCFAAENVLLGITQRGMTASVRRALADVVCCLQTGSLYDAIAQAKAIPAESKDAIFITDVRLLSFINKIEDYLGVTRSVSL